MFRSTNGSTNQRASKHSLTNWRKQTTWRNNSRRLILINNNNNNIPIVASHLIWQPQAYLSQIARRIVQRIVQRIAQRIAQRIRVPLSHGPSRHMSHVCVFVSSLRRVKLFVLSLHHCTISPILSSFFTFFHVFSHWWDKTMRTLTHGNNRCATNANKRENRII